jgi:O-antigen/teichoic acid export membrane protein
LANHQRALSGVRNDYFVSMSASASVALTSVVLFAVIGRLAGEDVLGDFSQIRRVAALWVPLGTLGLSMSLGRFVPRLADRTIIRRRAFQCFASVVAVLLLHLQLIDKLWQVGALQPVTGSDPALTLPFVSQVFGLCALVMPYALLRGMHRIRSAAALQVTGYAAWPLIAAVLFSDDVPHLIAAIGIGQMIIAGLAALLIGFWGRPKRVPEAPTDDGFRDWLTYGLIRLPGGVFGFLMWAGLPMVLVTWGLSADVGRANAVISLVNLPVLILSPLAFVLLPRLSLAQVQGEDAEVATFLAGGLRAIWELQLPGTVTLALLLGPVLHVWLGFPSDNFLVAGHWMIAAIPAVALFLFVRPALDAGAVMPYAVIAQGVGLAGGAAIVWLTASQRDPVDLGIAFFVAQTLTAAVALFSCRRQHGALWRLPCARLALQAAPLVLGVVVIEFAGLSPATLSLWCGSLVAYIWVLQRTESPLIAAAATALGRWRR